MLIALQLSYAPPETVTELPVSGLLFTLERSPKRFGFCFAASTAVHILSLLVLAFVVEFVWPPSARLGSYTARPFHGVVIDIRPVQRLYYPTGNANDLVLSGRVRPASTQKELPAILYGLTASGGDTVALLVPRSLRRAALLAPSLDRMPPLMPINEVYVRDLSHDAQASEGRGDGPPEVAASVAEAAVPSRIVHTRAGQVEIRDLPDGSQEWYYPPDGFFDAVLTQVEGSYFVPEADDLLAGRPVQTVYVTVGPGRDWILQFASPKGVQSSVTQSGMIVTLGSAPKLQAPWIQMAALPASQSLVAGKSSVFYGTLNASGRLESLQSLRSAQYTVRADLLPFLEKWEFRPARRDGVPADVDILLIVPSIESP